jgi:nicotinamide-nucleotide amidase
MITLVKKIKVASNGRTVSVAESCTGGMLSAYLTSIPGASSYFISGIVTYSDEAKMKLLSVSKESLNKYSAVSEGVAKDMAIAAKKITGSDIAVSITGIAGPDGGTPSKPVGTVCFGAASEETVKTYIHYLKGNREQIRTKACKIALEIILDLMED